MKIRSISKLSLNVTEWFEREMNMKPNFNIDIVVPWVDGQDPEWLHKKMFTKMKHQLIVELMGMSVTVIWERLNTFFKALKSLQHGLTKCTS